MYLMSPLFCEKGGDTIQGRTLYKGGHYLRRYGMYIEKTNVNKEGNSSHFGERGKVCSAHDRTNKVWRQKSRIIMH